MEQENMEVMEQEKTPEEEENGQVPAGDPADQPENEKTFTQEEVNKIIQKRLDRERQKNELRNNPDEYIKSLEEREAEVLKRELRAEADRMRISELESRSNQVQPVEILNYLDYSNEEAMKESFEKFQEDIVRPITREIWKLALRGKAPRTGGTVDPDRGIKDAFKPKR